MTRQDIFKMSGREIVFAYLRAEYGDTVSDDLINEVIDEDLSREQIDAIVGSVQDQPHLIDR